MKKIIYGSLGLMLVLLAGCATGSIGSREFPLMITTSHKGVPFAGATAYVVPDDDWVSSGKNINDPDCRKFLESYKVTDGPTPVQIYGMAYKMDIIIDWNNHLTLAATQPVPGARPSINVDVP